MAFTATVIGCTEWGAVPAKVGAFSPTTPRWVVVHHTAHPNPPNDVSKRTLDGAFALAKSIQNDHMNKNGWYDSGHNFLNTTAGFLLEGRHGSREAAIAGRGIQSAHAPQSSGKLAGGNNSHGIENEGNFMTAQMAPEQWSSLVELCASLCSSCVLAPTAIKGHRDFTATACPGDWLYAQLPKLRLEVAQRLNITLTETEAKNV